MKKNAMLKIAAILMVAVLLTTCAISSTFAKYTTSKTDTVTARVAKWGVSATTSLSGVFAKEYKNGENTTVLATDSLVVAPGTSMTDANFKVSIAGTPEVSARVEVVVDVTLTGWKLKDGTTFYCPLVFNKDTEDEIDGSKFNSATALEEEIEKYLTISSKDIAVDTTFAQDLLNKSLTWEWPFDNDDGSGNDLNAVNDTYLGDQAALGNASTIKLDITTTITQID